MGMVPVMVVRYSRKKKLGDAQSPLIYLLKQKAGDSKVYDLGLLASEIETIGSLSVEDVRHVLQSFVRAMKKVLVAGNRVKVDGLGTFFLTLTCQSTEVEKECTVKNIKRVNLRFLVDNTLRLVNDSVASTRSAPNNIFFEMASAGAAGGGGAGEPEDPGI